MKPDKEDIFSNDHILDDLGALTLRGGSVTIVTQFLRLQLSIGPTIILARLLTPEDFGIVAMLR